CIDSPHRFPESACNTSADEAFASGRNRASAAFAAPCRRSPGIGVRPKGATMSQSPQYEFSQEQNALIGSLASKMRFVGLFFLAVGVLNVLIALLVVVAVFRDRVPQKWVDQLPAEAKAKVEEQKDKLPANNHLWGIAINAGVVGLFYLVMGAWTQAAGDSFRKIVDTQGSDISHLMSALSSLHSMYALVYTLLVVTILLGLVALGVTLFQQFGGG